MQTYIALLRGINVSGKNIIKMEALRLAMQELAFAHVRTYIQSGNIIFNSKTTNTTTLAKCIKDKITTNFGFNVPVAVFNSAYLNNVINANPFLNYNQQLLHVTFLSQIPKQDLVAKINGDFNTDEFIIIDKHIYIFCPNGYGKTKLTNNFFENKLKLQATTRNWKTLETLATMATTI